MKKLIKISLCLGLITLFAQQGFAQNKGTYFTKLGIGYTFSGKQNRGFELNLGSYYSLSDYLYTGPKISLTKRAGEKALVNIGPEFGTHLINTITNIVGDQTSSLNTNFSAQLSVYLGFNLDQQNDLHRLFLLNKTTLSFSLASPKVLNNHLYLGYDISSFYHIDKLKTLSTVGLGTNLY